MRYELDLADHEPRTVHFVRGALSRPGRKTFRNAAAMDRWIEREGGNVTIDAIERAN